VRQDAGTTRLVESDQSVPPSGSRFSVFRRPHARSGTYFARMPEPHDGWLLSWLLSHSRRFFGISVSVGRFGRFTLAGSKWRAIALGGVGRCWDKAGVGVVCGILLETRVRPPRPSHFASARPRSQAYEPHKARRGIATRTTQSLGHCAGFGNGATAWILHVEYELTLVFYYPRHPTIQRDQRLHQLPTPPSTPLLP
jgi:hypothetical protein